MSTLPEVLETIQVRTGASFDLTNGESRSRFLIALRKDISTIVHMMNVVYLPLLQSLVDDSLDTGIAGTTVYTDPTATAGSAVAYYDEDLVRPKTVKETIDTLLVDIAALQAQVGIVE